MSNLYGVLGLTAGADPGQVKTAFHALAKRSHPDINTSDATALQRFKEINEAYEILSDPERRAVYDLGRKHERAETRWRFWNTMMITAVSFTITVGCGLYLLLHHGGRQNADAHAATDVTRSSSRSAANDKSPAKAERLLTSGPPPRSVTEPSTAGGSVTATKTEKTVAAIRPSGLPPSSPVRQAKSGQAPPSTAQQQVEVHASTPTTDQPEKTAVVSRASGAVPSTPDPQEERAQALHLYVMGMERIGRGDVVAARSLFQLAAKKGSVRSMRALAGTYDPVQLAELKVLGMSPNFDAAREWYEKVGDLDAIAAAEQVARAEEAAGELRRMSNPVANLAQFRAAYLSGEGLAYVAVNDETGEQIYRYGDPSRSKARKNAQTYTLFLCEIPYVFTPRKPEDLAALLRATVVSPGDLEFGDLDAKYLSACPGTKSAIQRN